MIKMIKINGFIYTNLKMILNYFINISKNGKIKAKIIRKKKKIKLILEILLNILLMIK